VSSSPNSSCTFDDNTPYLPCLTIHRNAMYNILVIGAIVILLGVGLVLGPFFKPLLWAFLFGALLFPAKQSLSDGLHAWIDRVEAEDKHLLLGIITLPVEQVDKLGRRLAAWLFAHLKVLSVIVVGLVLIRLLMAFAPKEFFLALFDAIIWCHSTFCTLLSFLTIQIVIGFVIAYVIAVYFLWTPHTSNAFLITGQALWLVICGYCCSFLGALQLPLFLGLLIYGLVGLIYSLNNSEDTHIFGRCKTMLEQSSYSSVPSTPSAVQPASAAPSPGGLDPSKILEIKTKMQLNVPTKPEDNQPKVEESLESDLYFRILFYCCLATVLFKHTWIIFLACVPVFVHGVKYVSVWSGLVAQVTLYCSRHKQAVEEWLIPRQAAIFPVCLPGVLQINGIVHKYVCSKFKTYIDDISALVTIVFLIVFVIFVSAFSFAQIYSETITVAQLGSNLVNRTLTHRPDLIEMLPIGEDY
jgi:hypothetical protein